MRRKCCLSNLLILFFLLPVWCFAAPDKQEHMAGDVVQIAVSDIPISFSPYADNRLAEQYSHLFFDPLLRWRADRQLEPRLVEKWEKVGPDLTRFYLKQNIKFHSGNDLTSQDVIWTFAEIRRNPKVNPFFDGIVNIVAQNSSSFDVQSELSEQQLLDYLTHFFVLDSIFYTAKLNTIDDKLAEGLVPDNQLYLSGTGPYQLRDYNSNTHLNVLNNENYWERNDTRLALSFIKIKSEKSRFFALLSSDVDISAAISDNMLLHFSTSQSVVKIVSPRAMFLTIHDNKTDVFKQKKAREAIRLAINEVGMLKQYVNGSGGVSSTFSPPLEDIHVNHKPYLPSYNVDKSRYYLNQLKVPKQLTLLVMVDQVENTQEVADALTKLMLLVGIQLKITTVSKLEDWEKMQFNYDFTLSPWRSELIDSKNIYHDLFIDSCLADFIEHLFIEAKLAGSIDSRAKVFELAQQENKIIPLFFENQLWASDKKYNLDEIFSANGIPYWAMLKIKTPPSLNK
ncbi:MAG: peptide/nickel transport system substrate-binding protein [Psychromonas sp.]|jgi:peptide/nickel transport system substrate-binding protein